MNHFSREFWEGVYARDDPSDRGGGAYEQWKFDRTISVLGKDRVETALDLGCGEGRLTERLAAVAGKITAVDISGVAVARAKERRGKLRNVKFRTLDFASDPLPGLFDLIVCSEVLYYFPREALAGIATKLAAALRPGGRLLVAHGGCLADDKSRTGFDWAQPFGARTIGEALGACPDLALSRRLSTPLFAIELYKRAADGETAAPETLEEALPFDLDLPIALERTIVWGGATTTRAEAMEAETSATVPILMYHSIADDGPSELRDYRVAPRAFREQMQFLRRNGYYSLTLTEWARCIADKRSLAGRPVIITFDDGYQDFIDNAWPELQKADLSATMFVVTDKIGGEADWDKHSHAPLKLMPWQDLRRLVAEGATIGSHTASHKDLSTISPEVARSEGERARRALRENLGFDTEIIAFPWGNSTPATRAALLQCGYKIAVSTDPGISGFDDDPLNLPRVEVLGRDNVEAFAAKLAGRGLAPEPPAEAPPAAVRLRPSRAAAIPAAAPPEFGRAFAARLDALVGEFVRLQSELLRRLTPADSLQRKITGLFTQPVTGRTLRPIESGDEILRGVRFCFDEGVEATMTVTPKSDHGLSPESYLNSVRFDIVCAGGWCWLEFDFDWGELSGAERFQLNLYAQSNRAVDVQAQLRLPRLDGAAREMTFAEFEIAEDARNAVASGEIAVPDLIEFDVGARPQLAMFFDAGADLSLTLHYMNVYFA